MTTIERGTGGKRFAIIGAAGFIASRHMAAIQRIGGELVAAFDVRDSVGILDRFSHEIEFFLDVRSFAAYLEDHRERIDYVVVCSPTDLHEEHCELACARGVDVICEKPLALGPEGVERLQQIELRTGRRIHPVLQLRYHSGIAGLLAEAAGFRQGPSGPPLDVTATYITRRGPWYALSWKGDVARSGGILLNLGVHLFDLLILLFGPPLPAPEAIAVDAGAASDRVSGTLRLAAARVRWCISTRNEDLPETACRNGCHAHRTIALNGRTAVDFSHSYAHLHNTLYERITGGEGLAVSEARPAIDLITRIRRAIPEPAGARAR